MLRENPQPILLKDYRPPRFFIDSVDLHFELDEADTRVHSRMELRRNPAADAGDGSVRLDGEQLELLGIALNGETLDSRAYRLDAEGLTLLSVPDRFRLETEVLIHPAANTALEGLYRSGPMLCTQCEAEGFRKITYFLDRPDVMSRFRTTLVAAVLEIPTLQRITVGEQYRVADLVPHQSGAKTAHHVRPIEEIGDLAETLRLALGAEPGAGAVESLQGGVGRRMDQHLGFQTESVRY